MLSKKYLAIKKVLSVASEVDFFHRKLVVLSEMYEDINRGYRFSYISDENGETEFLDALSEHYRNGFLYFDVGAHIGTYTDMVVARFENYMGHLFDVTKDTFDRCLERHGGNDNLIINNAALSESVGEIEYRSYPGDPTRNGISGVGPEANFEFDLLKAPCWTGDHYCKNNQIQHIDLLKIDAEGYDLFVMRGFEEMIINKKVDIIQFEYNVKHSETHCMLGDFYTFLIGKGYIIGALRPEGVAFQDFDFMQNDFKSGPNYVACLPEFRDLLSRFN